MHSMIKTFLAAMALCLAASAAAAQQTAATVDYVWLQMTGQDKASLRAIVQGDCYGLIVALGPQRLGMRARHPDTMEKMGGRTVCELPIDFTATTASAVQFAGHTIPLPRTAPSRVLVLGDTGCRKEDHANDQVCGGAGWFFKTIADAALKTKPDLIVHVGDYVYRYNCGWEVEGCGDGQLREWGYWDSDFFSQAVNILPTAPWVFVRGNHEDCSEHYSHRRGHEVNVDRGWRGWSLFLAMDDTVQTGFQNCKDNEETTPPAVIRFPAGQAPALTLMALDTADEQSPAASDFAPLASGGEAWVVTHVPLWYVGAYYTAPLPDTLDMVISGHEHLFRMVIPTLAPARAGQPAKTGPVQLLEGASGTKRDFNGPIYPQYAPQPALNYVDTSFSFTILDRKANRTTDVVLCTVKSDGTVTATYAWTVSRQPDGMVALPLILTPGMCS